MTEVGQEISKQPTIEWSWCSLSNREHLQIRCWCFSWRKCSSLDILPLEICWLYFLQSKCMISFWWNLRSQQEEHQCGTQQHGQSIDWYCSLGWLECQSINLKTSSDMRWNHSCPPDTPCREGESSEECRWSWWIFWLNFNKQWLSHLFQAAQADLCWWEYEFMVQTTRRPLDQLCPPSICCKSLKPALIWYPDSIGQQQQSHAVAQTCQMCKPTTGFRGHGPTTNKKVCFTVQRKFWNILYSFGSELIKPCVLTSTLLLVVLERNSVIKLACGDSWEWLKVQHVATPPKTFLTSVELHNHGDFRALLSNSTEYSPEQGHWCGWNGIIDTLFP